jgi:hypothetical protein
MAERDVLVERLVLEARRRLDRGDDLPRYAELGEAAEGRLLVGAEVPDGLVQADQALLDQILRVAAGEEVRARLQPDEARVPTHQALERRLVAVPSFEDELQILELPLCPLCGLGGRCALGSHFSTPARGSARRSLTLRLRQKIADGPCLYKDLAMDLV